MRPWNLKIVSSWEWSRMSALKPGGVQTEETWAFSGFSLSWISKRFLWNNISFQAGIEADCKDFEPLLSGLGALDHLYNKGDSDFGHQTITKDKIFFQISNACTVCTIHTAAKSFVRFQIKTGTREHLPLRNPSLKRGDEGYFLSCIVSSVQPWYIPDFAYISYLLEKERDRRKRIAKV